jgi:tetratricopeptide (TPR) repeat protein
MREAQKKASRAVELQHAVLVIGGLILLVAIFYAGRKFDYVKYAFMSRINAKELEGGPDKFPGVTSEELIETALAAEKRGDWQEAAERFIAAKRKNRAMPGILFRLGKSSYDRGDMQGAEIALEHAIRFGENLPVANYYRGLIAVRRHDLAAGTRFFEAAANAEPFVADFHYFWGEALRLDHHPREAIKRYQQAVLRTPSTQDATLCQFKIRLARIEAAEAPKIAAEVEEARKAGDLSVDWLMTDAALLIHAGKIAGAAQRISEARAKGLSGLYLTCAGDTVFRKAAETYPEIAALVAPQIPSPTPIE